MDGHGGIVEDSSDTLESNLMIAFARPLIAEPALHGQQTPALKREDPDHDRDSLRNWLWERARVLGGIFAELRARIFTLTSANGEIVDDAVLIQEDPELLALRTKLVMLLATRDAPSRMRMERYWKLKRSSERSHHRL